MGLRKDKTDNNKKKVLRALKKHRGLVRTSCAAAGIGKTAYYEWYHNDEAFKAAVDEIMALECEWVESKLQGLIEADNASSIQFYLKNKSKDYKPKLEVDAKVDIKINPIKIVNPNKK